MTKTGLVLEGGGMRGIYTAGVLDVFLDHNITVDGVIGVSAGAIHGASFVSKQRGRNIAYSLEYRNNKEYMSLKSLLKTGNLFGVDFCYDRLPNELYKFDYDAFEENPTRFYVCCTNVETGQPEYLECTDLRKDMDKHRVTDCRSRWQEVIGWRNGRQHSNLPVPENGISKRYRSFDQTGRLCQGRRQHVEAGSNPV